MSELNKQAIHFMMDHVINFEIDADEYGRYQSRVNGWDEDDILKSIEEGINNFNIDYIDTEEYIYMEDLNITIRLDDEREEVTAEYATVDIELINNPHDIDPADLLAALTDKLSDEFSPENITDSQTIDTTFVEGRKFETIRNENGKTDIFIDDQLQKSTLSNGQVTYYKDKKPSRKEYANGDVETYKDGIRQKMKYADGRVATYNDKGQFFEGQFGSKETGFNFYSQGTNTHSINANNDRFDFTHQDIITIQRNWGNTEVYGRSSVSGIFESELQSVTAKNGDRVEFQNGYPISGNLHYKDGSVCEFANGKPMNGTMMVDEYANRFGYLSHIADRHVGKRTYAYGEMTINVKLGKTEGVVKRPETTTFFSKELPQQQFSDMTFLGLDKIIAGDYQDGKPHHGDFHNFTSSYRDVTEPFYGTRFYDAIEHFSQGVKVAQSYIKQPFIHTFGLDGKFQAQINPDLSTYNLKGEVAPLACLSESQQQLISMVVPQKADMYEDLPSDQLANKIMEELSTYGLPVNEDVKGTIVDALKNNNDVTNVLASYNQSVAKEVMEFTNSRTTPTPDTPKTGKDITLNNDLERSAVKNT